MLLGLTMEELADFFGVHISSIYRWMDNYESFREAIKKGKALARTPKMKLCMLRQ